MVDSLADGSLFAELQISTWPPAVTQTLLRKSDGQRTLVVRGKPSGRLRVMLEREGYQPIVVRTVHLRLRAPTILKVNVTWRGTDMVVAASGQVIGSSREFDPQGVLAPAEVEQTAAPIDHVDNARARDLRGRQIAALFSDRGGATEALAARWLGDLGQAANVLADLGCSAAPIRARCACEARTAGAAPGRSLRRRLGARRGSRAGDGSRRLATP
jgi:hypothetical protein